MTNHNNNTNYNLITLLKLIIITTLTSLLPYSLSQENTNNGNSDEDVPICGGFIQFDDTITKEMKQQIDYSSIVVKSYNHDMVMKEQTNLAASGYYFLPIYEKESFILKISGPHGMSFEPNEFVFNLNDDKTVEEICKDDINFKFRGYYINGQISTFGSNDGKKDVKLLLLNNKKETIQHTYTEDKGKFKFQPLLPSVEQYIIKPAQDEDIFDENHKSFSFKININASNYFERALIIKGYSLEGRVMAEDQPVENVSAFIYSNNSTLVQDFKCEESSNENSKDIKTILTSQENELRNIAPFCTVKTNKEGVFKFKNIPYGNFFIKTAYRGEHISYDIKPEEKDIEIKHESLTIEDFKVTNFAISGKVINNLGNGVPNVTIKIDGQVKGVSDKNGNYFLQKLQAGNFDLEAQADDMYFEPLTNIRITAYSKSLPELVVSHYKLCGKIRIEANDSFSNSKRTVVLVNSQDTSTKKERRTITDGQGRYCFEVKPGKYHVYPVLTKAEKEAELHLNPESMDIEVIDRPLLEINFYQSKVEITGVIECIDKPCDKDIKIFLSSTKSDKLVSAQIESTNNTNNNNNKEFAFRDILSGQYKLFVKKHEWCWETEEMQIKVQNNAINNITFKQNGYSLFYQSQHNIDIILNNTQMKVKDHKTTLVKNKSKLCLPHKGEYTITTNSCHKFKEEKYTYNTANVERLVLNPTEYLVKGIINLNNKVLNKFKGKEIKTILNIEEFNKEKNALDFYKSSVYKTNDKSNQFNFYTKPKTNLIITPEINAEIKKQNPDYEKLIFHPKFKQIKVEENCLENLDDLKFEMRSGLIIEGSVTPAMEDVEVKAFNKENDELIASAKTMKDGKYKIGPLYTEYSYNLKAIKEGYKIVSQKDSIYHFTAEKLSFLRVKVIDTNKKPLSSVFLSLSSADRGFRINNNTNNDGYFDFTELYSGDYYIKPLFKEYKFEPSQKQVSIKGGLQYEEEIIAHRIAFSIFGKSKFLFFILYKYYIYIYIVNNLNRERVEGLSIQAYDLQTEQLQETSIDKNMEYRLKGLIPDHKYIIKVKIPNSSHIEKALPSNIPITLGKADVFGIDFVVLQRPKKVDIRGYINYKDEDDKCPLEKVNNLSVELRKITDNETEETPIVKKMSQACLFYYVGLEKIQYQVKIVEKQGNNKGSKVLYEEIADLSDERGINNGVKVLKIDISNKKKNTSDNVSTSIYSSFFLFGFIFVFFQWETSKWIFDKFLGGPLGGFFRVFSGKKY